MKKYFFQIFFTSIIIARIGRDKIDIKPFDRESLEETPIGDTGFSISTSGRLLQNSTSLQQPRGALEK